MFGIFGGILGLALGGGIALLLEFRDRSIRTERDVEHILQLPTLALLPVVGEEPEEKHERPSRWKIWKRNKHHQDLEPEVKGQAVGA